MSVKAVYHSKHLPDHGVELPPTTRLVLLMIADYANEENVAWPKYASLTRYTGLCRRSVIRAVKDLVDAGLMQRHERKRPDGSDTSNGYVLTFVPRDIKSPPSLTGTPWGDTQSKTGDSQSPPGCTTVTPRTTNRTSMNKTSPQPPELAPATPAPKEEEGGQSLDIQTPNTQPDPEVAHALTIAERRRATNHSASLLAQQHPLVWTALTDLQSIYSWKPPQFAAIASQLLTLARENTDSRVELACRAVIETGATITHPIAYVRKLLTTSTPDARHNAPTSLLAGLPDPSAWTLD